MSLRLRQAVLAARDLEATVAALRESLDLRDGFSDPAVGMFGLRNAVFALGDTFLEVVSPHTPDASAARLLERRGPVCGYMLMFQVDDVGAVRERAAREGVREVFSVTLDDMDEVHLHPSDMRGPIVSASRPLPAQSWRWGGPGWEERRAPFRLCGASLAVAGAAAVRARWETILGGRLTEAGVDLTADGAGSGLEEIVLAGSWPGTVELAGVRLRIRAPEEEDR